MASNTGQQTTRDFLKDVVSPLTPLLATVVALTSVITVTVTQVCNNQTQANLSKFQVTYLKKEQLYADLLQHFSEGFVISKNDDVEPAIRATEATYFGIEPFLDYAQRQSVWEDVQQWEALCLEKSKTVSPTDANLAQWTDRFIQYRNRARELLSPALFGIRATQITGSP